MRLLLDTHFILWAGDWVEDASAKSRAARELITDPDNLLHFSPVTVWEVAIKSRRRRDPLPVDAQIFPEALIEAGYIEVPITAAHAAAVAHLPPIHKDPFDRMVVARATVEGLALLTADATIARYPGPVRRV